MTPCPVCIHDHHGACAVHVCAQVRTTLIAAGVPVWHLLPTATVAASVKRKEMAT
jgi:hypothetical protein